jgi:Ca2+-binding EF-hand superfamily protein
MSVRNWLAPSLIVAVITVAGATAPSAQTLQQLTPPRVQLLANDGLEKYLQRVEEMIRNLAGDQQAVTMEDVREIDLVMETMMRGQMIGTLLQFDLNDDGKVTEREIQTSLARRLPLRSASAWAPTLSHLMRHDRNGDGVIDAQEMRQAQFQILPHETLATTARALLEMDPDKDGRLTIAEAVALAEKIWHAADTDGNGVLSDEELIAVGAKRPLTRR